MVEILARGIMACLREIWAVMSSETKSVVTVETFVGRSGDRKTRNISSAGISSRVYLEKTINFLNGIFAVREEV
jgi:hypothetical protein